jgi:hypothetical protein
MEFVLEIIYLLLLEIKLMEVMILFIHQMELNGTKHQHLFLLHLVIMQNYNNVNQTGFYGLTLPQSNLLTTYCDWSLYTIYNNDTTVKSFLNNL